MDKQQETTTEKMGKPYTPPELTEWGSIGDLTTGLSGFSYIDGGVPPFNTKASAT